MKKMTKGLACLVLVLVLACCALPGVTYGATTSVDLNQNYLFRTRTNAFSFGAGETANLTFYAPVHGGIHLKAVRSCDRRAEYPCQPDEPGRHGHGL